MDADRLAAWLAGVHDIGKITPAFAVMARDVGMGDLTDAMERHGLAVPSLTRTEKPRHTVTGHLAVQEWLQRVHRFPATRAEALASVVGAHHGVAPTASVIGASRPETLARAWGTGAWDEVRAEVLDGLAAQTGVTPVLERIRARKLHLTTLIDLSAMVIVADWLASDVASFPYELDSATHHRLAEAAAHFDLPPPWHAEDPGDITVVFHSRFPRLAGVLPSGFQHATLEAARLTQDAPLLVIEAPTGSGKSEAALMAAEVLAARHGCGGVFVALPTMATSDAMFDRVLSWVEHLPNQGRTSMWLAHGKAALNERFDSVRRDSRVHAVHDDEGSSTSTTARVSSWLHGRKRGLLANFVVGTIDQVLMGGLQSRHLALRHLALSGKVVIVDEVHAADDYMRAYLGTILRYLGAYGTPVVLLSATLPPEQRSELLTAYLDGRLHHRDRGARPEGGRRSRRAQRARPAPSATDSSPRIPEGDVYPRLTVAASQVQDVPVTPPAHSELLHLERFDDDLGALAGLLEHELRDGGCVVIVRNTVRRAQEAYEMLRGRLGEEVELLHSRFMAPHRVAKERNLLARLGPPDQAERPHRLIVVGTQVLEQSLDIDADLLVTDLAPVDLVLQRVGRLHRHARSEDQRPVALATPRCLVTGVEDWEASPPRFEAGSETVYGAARLLRSLAVLRPHLDGEPVRLPHDVPALVRRAYDPDLRPPPGWEDAWHDAATRTERHRTEQLRRSMTFRVPEVGAKATLVGWMDAPQQEGTSDGGHAQVRDSEDGIEVILVQRDAAGVLRTLPGDFPGAGRDIPLVPEDRSPLTRHVAACTVRLPQTMTRFARGDRTIEELERTALVDGWQQSRWLQGQLVLPLAEDLTARVAGFDISYSSEQGLAAAPTRAEDA